jgi:hypothetical protein
MKVELENDVSRDPILVVMVVLCVVPAGFAVLSGEVSSRKEVRITGTGGGRTAPASAKAGLGDLEPLLSPDIGAVADRRTLPMLSDGRAPKSNPVSGRETDLVFARFKDEPMGDDPALSFAFVPLGGKFATSKRSSWIVRFPWCKEYSRRYSARSAQPPPTRTITRSPFSPTRRT